MPRAEWQKVREIFDSALRHSPEARQNYVREACADDKTLLAEVESLLSSHDGAESFMVQMSLKLKQRTSKRENVSGITR